MNALIELGFVLVMIVFWSVELFYGLLNRDFIIIFLSFLLLMIWFDELFPFKKEFKPGFGAKILFTVVIVLAQQMLRLFL